MTFEWDPRKDSLNRRQHGVSFQDATAAFADPLARIFDDPDHSLRERRELLVGHSAAGRLLLISFTERAEAVRLFSAREATPRERREYEENKEESHVRPPTRVPA